MVVKPTTGFMTQVTCRLTTKDRDQLRNPTLGNRVWATFTFLVVVVNLSTISHGDAENARTENDGQRKLWVWKMQDWKMTDKLLANCEHNYVCIFDVYLANYRKTLLELD